MFSNPIQISVAILDQATCCMHSPTLQYFTASLVLAMPPKQKAAAKAKAKSKAATEYVPPTQSHPAE